MTRRWPPALAACLLLAAGTVAAQTPEQEFAAANAAYQAGRHEEAAAAYRNLIERGIADVRVEYNLGCAAFKLGRIGEAILHYERAHRLAPRDGEIRDSLEVARDRVLDRIEQSEPSGLILAMRKAQDALGLRGHFVLVLLSAWAIAAVVTWALLRPGGFPALAGWGVAGLAAATALAAVSWWFTWQRFGGVPAGVVMQPVVEVVAGPGGDNPALFTLHEGTTVEIRGEHDDWSQVSLSNGLNGWVPRGAVEPI